MIVILDQLSKDLQFKIKQYNILVKELEGIKKHSSHSRSQIKNTTMPNSKISSSMLRKDQHKKRGLSQPLMQHNGNANQIKKYEHNKITKSKL